MNHTLVKAPRRPPRPEPPTPELRKLKRAQALIDRFLKCYVGRPRRRAIGKAVKK